jgi:SAM-dependent methyltransferase
MKENRYDDPQFFEKYGQMARSQKGLAGAGEWRELKKLLPDFSGKRVLDLGCGYGWHCGYAAAHGAAGVLGTDISQKMLETARERNPGPSIEYRQAAMEDLRFPDGSFDVVLSSLAFHYVEEFGALVRNIGRWLAPGGRFVFSVEHPVFTAYGSQDWYYGPDGEILHFPVDNYYLEGPREAVFLGERVVKYHRTLTTYLDALLQNGFQILRVVEPPPPENMLDLPGMRDELRRPMMLLVSAVKENPDGWIQGQKGR